MTLSATATRSLAWPSAVSSKPVSGVGAGIRDSLVGASVYSKVAIGGIVSS